MTMRRLFPGFRPSALILFSVVWVSVGVSLVTRNDTVPVGHPLPLEYLPLWARVGFWWAGAVGGLIAAFWPPGKDKWGWVSLSIPASLRVVSFAIAAGMGWIEPTAAISWTVILVIMLLLSAWPEPPKEQVVSDG